MYVDLPLATMNSIQAKTLKHSAIIVHVQMQYCITTINVKNFHKRLTTVVRAQIRMALI